MVPGAAFHNYRLIAVPRSGMPPMPRDFSVAPFDEPEVVRYSETLELPRAAIRHRMEQGMTCLAAMRDGRVTGVNFVTTGPFDEDEVAVCFVPPPCAAWDTGLFVCPAQRGGRTFAALWAGTAEWLAERGLDWSMSRIAHYNLPSLASHQRMGGVEIGRLNALRVGGRQYLFGADPVVRLQLP